jgi:hypothetical protein
MGLLHSQKQDLTLGSSYALDRSSWFPLHLEELKPARNIHSYKYPCSVEDEDRRGGSAAATRASSHLLQHGGLMPCNPQDNLTVLILFNDHFVSFW